MVQYFIINSLFEIEVIICLWRMILSFDYWIVVRLTVHSTCLVQMVMTG